MLFRTFRVASVADSIISPIQCSTFHAFMMRAFVLTVAGSATSGWAQCAPTPATLQQATATFSQTCGGSWGPAGAIDGNYSTGWAIYSNGSCGSLEFTFDQTAVFECASTLEPLSPGQPFRIVVSLLSGGNQGNVLPHSLGLFRLSVTGDDRSTFADGLLSGGDVSANWTVLTLDSLRAVPTNNAGVDITGVGATLTVQPDGSVLASGANPEFTRYELIATSPFPAVTGVRLEVFDINGASNATALGLPTGGPGRAVNGNFIVRQMRVGRAPCLEVCSQPQSASSCASGSQSFSVGAAGVGVLGYQWQVESPPGSGTFVNVSDGALAGVGVVSGSASSQVTVSSLVSSSTAAFRCVVSNTCGPLNSNAATLTVGQCDCIDVNNDSSLFDPQDIDAFLSVFGEGPCIPETATCNDIDFNNDGSLFDPCDIDSFLVVFGEGPCTLCGT